MFKLALKFTLGGTDKSSFKARKKERKKEKSKVQIIVLILFTTFLQQAYKEKGNTEAQKEKIVPRRARKQTQEQTNLIYQYLLLLKEPKKHKNVSQETKAT